MKLGELLEHLCPNDYIGIWDIEYPVSTRPRRYKRPFEERPTQQRYFKVKNIPFGRIQYFLKHDVYGICHTEKGLLVRIGKIDDTHESLSRHQLAYEIARQMQLVKGGTDDER